MMPPQALLVFVNQPNRHAFEQRNGISLPSAGPCRLVPDPHATSSAPKVVLILQSEPAFRGFVRNAFERRNAIFGADRTAAFQYAWLNAVEVGDTQRGTPARDR